MPKLNQIIAVEKGVKTQTAQDVQEAYGTLQKPALSTGISRTYRPRDEEGETLPAEATRVQVRAEGVLRETAESLTKLFDITATKDYANCNAKADVVVEGNVLLAQVPATYLLFLEKQLTELQILLKRVPTLDASETWNFDTAADCWATEPVQTLRTKKVPRNHVKAEATDKHPAQVEVYYEDITVGTWRTVRFSGAIEGKRLNEMLRRLDNLQQAVKFAREAANALETEDIKIGEKLFGYLLA